MDTTFTTQNIIRCALFTALIAVGAFIKIPIPVLPFTLQFLFTMLGGLLLGGELGAMSVLAYIALGLMGLPIFADGGGIAYALRPTFGYLIGFCIASYVTGTIANKVGNPTLKRLLVANFIGLVIVYFCGTLYYWIISDFVINTPIGLWPLIFYCVILAVPGDIFLCIISAFLGKRLLPIIKKSKTHYKLEEERLS